MPLVAGDRLGPYEVTALLGEGGMGEVYLAHDSRLDRRVAIKLLPAHLAADTVARERLRREAMAAAALDHPFICKVFEIGEDARTLFIAMEHVSGETLLERLRSGRLPLAETLRIAGEIAEALEFAHARGFVHRDLKPANVLLTQQGGKEVAVLADFGLARVYQASKISGLTMEREVGGTVAFLAPEQITHFREVMPPTDQ